MRTIAFLLAFLACAGRVHSDTATKPKEQSLAKLLMAYNPTGPVGKPTGTGSTTGSRITVRKPSSKMASVFTDDALEQFKEENPLAAKWGLGLSVKAERWNGRHAMFGWFFILCTAYARTHGLIPEPDKLLQYVDYGSLSRVGFGGQITNERAIILIANVHALGVSLAAAVGPNMLGDSLLLKDGEADEEPYGLFPPILGQVGLTPAAEMYNGRLAMLGITCVVLGSIVSGMDVLDYINLGTGGWLLSGKF